MRKLYTLLVIFVLIFGLAACTDNGTIDFPTFDEDNIVQLSAQEMVTLFESVDYTNVDTESMKVSMLGHIFVLDESDPEDIYSTYRNDIKMSIDASFYGLASDTIEEVRMHGEGEVDFSTTNEYDDDYTEPTTTSHIVKGSVGTYFVDGFLYVNADVEYSDDGADLENKSFKHKLDQEVTQANLDEVLNQADPDQLDNMIPYDYLDMIETADYDAIMEAVPNLKVYKDGDTHSIVFSINKQIILDSYEDMIQTIAEATGSEMSQTDISDMVTTAEQQINDVVETLEFTYVISITANKVTKVAEMLKFKSVDGKIDIDMTSVIEVGVELPSFPNDLDEYTLVSEIGEGVFDDKDDYSQKS